MEAQRKLKIVCAAQTDGSFIACGARHNDPVMRLQQTTYIQLRYGICPLDRAWDNEFLKFTNPENQGFLATDLKFYNRRDALRIAQEAGQVGDTGRDELKAEDLY